MRAIFLLLLLLSSSLVLHAKKFTVETRSTASLRAKLIAKNQLHRYVEEQRLRRVSNVLKSISEPLQDQLDSFYVAEVEIGTPGQRLLLAMDTTVTMIWVVDSDCTSVVCNGYPDSEYSKHKYNRSESSTAVKLEAGFFIRYGNGLCEGYLVKDIATFSGINVTTQEIGAAMYIDDSFGHQPIDGIFGLGWPGYALDNQNAPLRDIVSQLDEPIFTIWLDRMVSAVNGGDAGRITFGGFDNEHCESDIRYVPLTDRLIWEFSVDGFSIGPSRRLQKHEGCSASAESWIGAPKYVVDEIVKTTRALYDRRNNVYTVDCTSTLPDFVIIIGGVNYPIPSTEYAIDLGLGGGKCVLTFVPMDTVEFRAPWVLGYTFIRNFCNVYDVQGQRIGFSRAKHNHI